MKQQDYGKPYIGCLNSPIQEYAQHPYKGNRQYPYMGVHHYFYMKRSKSTTGNNTTDVRIAGSVSLPSTTYKAYLSSTDYKKDQQLKKSLDIYSIMHVLGIPIY